ncbi:MAG: class C sortase [Clostridiales bacterium]|nr:class C sortase [Clostridiales bacterium]
MKKMLAPLIIVAIFLIGLSILLYPVVSDIINSRTQTRVVAQYYKDLDNLDESDYTKLLEAAYTYNKDLLTNNSRFKLSDEEKLEYFSMLDFTGIGVIGSLEIEAIKVNLPIYQDTTESVLQIGAGHLIGSSLPVGGVGTHSVITGHTGLPSSTLLTNLDKLVIGDIFSLQVLKDKLIYEIDQIIVVAPEDFSNLGIDIKEDYCTLLTCTPYGINSHRLLVRGCRIFPEESTVRADMESNSQDITGMVWMLSIIIIILAAALVKRRDIRHRRDLVI